jgi:hemolysin D
MCVLDTLMRHVTVWCAAWQAEAAQPFAVTPSGQAVEFLPAVLEIQERPPSPLGRTILWTILVLFTVAVLWACVGWIDMVAVAPGKIIPSGYSKVIQPYETGVIAAIHVVDGQVVKRGDVLIELDPTINQADQRRSTNEYRATSVDALRLRALLAGELTFEAPIDADQPYVLLQQKLLLDEMAEHEAKRAAARHLIEQRRAALGATEENIRRLEETLPMERERVDTYKRLLAHEAATKLDYLQAEEQRIDRTQELAGQRQQRQQDEAAVAEAEHNYRALVSEFQQTKQTELATADTKAASLAQDVVQAGQRTELQKLVSPIDGVVQQLAVHTVGGVVTPAQQLLIVVPQDHPVEVEAQVENKDVGFVKEGQGAEIKVETFPFTLYGTIPGTVLTVSDDAIPLDRDNASSEKPSQDKATEQLVYATRVTLERSTIQVNGKTVNLSPGMAVTVEMKTGQRRIIEYLLSPLLKAATESMRER